MSDVLEAQGINLGQFLSLTDPLEGFIVHQLELLYKVTSDTGVHFNGADSHFISLTLKMHPMFSLIVCLCLSISSISFLS